MKTPLVVIIAIVAIIIGFLTVFSQQAGTPADKGVQEQGAAVSETAQAPSAGSEGTAQATQATDAKTPAPSGDHSK